MFTISINPQGKKKIGSPVVEFRNALSEQLLAVHQCESKMILQVLWFENLQLLFGVLIEEILAPSFARGGYFALTSSLERLSLFKYVRLQLAMI